MTRLETFIIFCFKLSTWKLKENEQNETFFFFKETRLGRVSFLEWPVSFGGRGGVIVEVRSRGNLEEMGHELWKWASRMGVLP